VDAAVFGFFVVAVTAVKDLNWLVLPTSAHLCFAPAPPGRQLSTLYFALIHLTL
jgi:hypothetical protein